MNPALIIFASGAGSNAKAIIEYFNSHGGARVALLVSDNPNAGALTMAQGFGIPTLVIEKQDLPTTTFLDTLIKYQPQLLVLAGFLKKIPKEMIQAFPQKIINLHPSLLPKYGGKGMYGMRVHQAVIAAGEKESGITIHFVNEHYDEGPPITQAKVAIAPNETAESLAEKIHTIEHLHLPKTIAKLLQEMQ